MRFPFSCLNHTFSFMQTFQGNRDQLSVQTHPINPAIYCRFVRIIPRGWRAHISMRLELYGSPWSESLKKAIYHMFDGFHLVYRAGLFESRLTLTQNLKLIGVSIFLVKKCFPLLIFSVVCFFSNSNLKDKQYKQKTTPKIKILANPGLA